MSILALVRNFIPSHHIIILNGGWNIADAVSRSYDPRNAGYTRWEHEHVVDKVQRRLDANPDAMRTRRESVERSFGTIKARMGATHFLMKRLPNVAREMALHVLAYNLARVLNIMGARPLMATIQR